MVSMKDSSPKGYASFSNVLLLAYDIEQVFIVRPFRTLLIILPTILVESDEFRDEMTSNSNEEL